MVRAWIFIAALAAIASAAEDHPSGGLRRLDLDLGSTKVKVKNMAVNSTTDATQKEVLATLLDKLEVVGKCLDYMWILVCGALVMFMQAGFAILESGTCRAKNAGTVLMKNLMDVCVGTIMWWLVGYGFAYGMGENPNKFIGSSQFAGVEFLETDSAGAIIGSDHLKDWFFQWAFCATAATIVSGAVAERIQFSGYVVYSIFMTGLIYPVVVYWTWSSGGWLVTEWSYSDFAGSSIVHMTGGFSALVGAIIVGPRNGRFDGEENFAPHNMGLVVLGTLILWFGWYGFNCGSTLSFSDVSTVVQAALVAMNTTLSAGAGGLIVFFVRFWRKGKYDLAGMCNGILAGLVAVCAGVGDMYPGMAVLTGVLGGLAMELGHELTVRLKIDDPLDAFAVHGCAGLMGALTRPLFDRTGYQGDMFAGHCLGVFCIILWVSTMSALVFGVLSLMGKLRVDVADQTRGADAVDLAQSDCYINKSPKQVKRTTEVKDNTEV